jgi:hypothetical protein
LPDRHKEAGKHEAKFAAAENYFNEIALDKAGSVTVTVHKASPARLDENHDRSCSA